MPAFHVENDIEKPDLSVILSPATLPCGQQLSNRLVKAATYEHLACYGGGLPNEALLELYRTWGQGHWGMVITGNVQVCPYHLSLGADMIIPDEITRTAVDKYCALARVIKENGSLAVMQINHAGRQSPNFIGGRIPFVRRPLSASATEVGQNSRDGILTNITNYILFQEAREMSEMDIADVTEKFVRGARLAHLSGFDGVQIHAAHGYLLTQFMSRKTNLRTDKFGPALAFLHHIFVAIRSSVPSNFIVGIKLNASDYVSGDHGEAESVIHLREIAQWNWKDAGVDFIEISGGDYEKPDFSTTSPRQILFEELSEMAVRAVESVKSSRQLPLIMLTGGLRTRFQFAKVLAQNHAQLLGVARLAILHPSVPRQLLEASEHPENDEIQAEIRNWENKKAPAPQPATWWPRIVGGGLGMAWYDVAIRRLVRGEEPPGRMNPLSILLEMYLGVLWAPRVYIVFVGALLGIVLDRWI